VPTPLGAINNVVQIVNEIYCPKYPYAVHWLSHTNKCSVIYFTSL